MLTIITQDWFTSNTCAFFLGEHGQLANFWCDNGFCECMLALWKDRKLDPVKTETRLEIRNKCKYIISKNNVLYANKPLFLLFSLTI